MPKYWMISDRSGAGDGGNRYAAGPRYFVSDGRGDPHNIANWERVTFSQFRKAITEVCDEFPDLPPEKNEEEKHLALCVHGYNNDFASAVNFYLSVNNALFSGDQGLGVCVLFTWPSKGEVYDYLPDREQARLCADDLADVLSNLYDVLSQNQFAAANDAAKACKAKVSIIAHSMGNFVTQLALFHAWKRHNRPLATSLVNQLLMVAADVDNNIFDSGEQVGDGSGEGIANLTYRVTALYSGRDPVLAVSAGLKHFFKRRLGRSGLDRTAGNGHAATPDNVWDTDCSAFFANNERDIHGAYFKLEQYAPVRTLMREVLRGVDRGVLVSQGLASANSWWPNRLA